MKSDLRAVLVDQVVGRLAAHNPRLGDGDRVATFPCPSGAMGDVAIDLDGPGAIVHIVGWTHGHFDDGTSSEVARDVTNFLIDLFDDEVVVWQTPTGAGGWFYKSHRRDGHPPAGARASTWRGPWTDPAG